VPRFYVHFRNGDFLAKDEEGEDFSGLDEAEAAAIISGREILAGDVKSNATNPLTEIVITSEDGTELVTISAKDLLPAPLK
jgi:hypothetical protein